MNWKKWKIGLMIAVVCGLLNAGAGLVAGMSWQAFIAVVCTSLLTNGLTFLKDHPLESVVDDPPAKDKGQSGFIRFFTAILFILSLPACARFTTRQTDISTVSTNGIPTRTITTEATARTFFDAKSQLTNFKATQTDKTQGASVGSLNQESSGSNAVQVLKIIVEGAKTAQ